MPAGLSSLTPRRVLAATMVLGAASLVWAMREQIFLFDEWSFFADYRGHSPSVLLHPFNENLELVPILIYKTVFALAGPEGLPLHLITAALNLTCAGLLYLLLERRVDAWIAVAASALVIFLGAAADVVAASLGIAVMFTVACGLGMLLALEREDQLGDRLAFVLLALALASNTVGVPFAVAAALEVGFVSARPCANRAWLVAIPVALYAIWKVWSLHLGPFDPVGTTPTKITLTNIGSLPSSVADSLSAALVSVTGLFAQPGIDARTFSTAFGPVLAVALGLAVYLRTRRGPPLSRRVVMFAAMPITYWVLIALVASVRAPTVARYQFGGVIMVMLLCAELARGIRISNRTRLTVIGVLVAALGANVLNLNIGSRVLRYNARVDRAELTAIELAGPRIQPGLLVEPIGGYFDPRSTDLIAGGRLVPTTDAMILGRRYLHAAHDLGSPAYSLAQLSAAPGYAREAADQELAAAFAMALKPTGPASCHQAAPGELVVPPGGVRIASPAGAPTSVQLRRFGTAYTVDLGAVPAGAARELAIPTDASRTPWRLRLGSPGATPFVCGVGVR